MIIFCQSFISANYDDSPKLTKQAAVMFANRVEETPFTTGPHVISISEAAARWGNSVTVWYRAMNKVEID